MDDTLCDYAGAHRAALKKDPHNKWPQSVYDFYRKLNELPDAIWGMNELERLGFDVWILTRPSYMNPTCYTEKRMWVEDHLGIDWCRKLILCPDKSLMKGEYLIDDQLWPDFEGEQILFRQEEDNFDYRTHIVKKSWKDVLDYFYERPQKKLTI